MENESVADRRVKAFCPPSISTDSFAAASGSQWSLALFASRERFTRNLNNNSDWVLPIAI